jgi:hypothetical protein
LTEAEQGPFLVSDSQSAGNVGPVKLVAVVTIGLTHDSLRVSQEPENYVSLNHGDNRRSGIAIVHPVIEIGNPSLNH